MKNHVQHSQGLWMFYKDQPNSFLVVTEGKTICMSNVTDIDNGNIDIDEAEANARLIAAAPDLLEACRLAVMALNIKPNFKTNHLSSYEIAAGIDRAILKATDSNRTGVLAVMR